MQDNFALIEKHPPPGKDKFGVSLKIIKLHE
jgi:hypothetical protein